MKSPSNIVVVVGGANVDVKLTLAAPPLLGTSNPGRMETSLGGVARNVAENLARLAVPTRLVSAVGPDVHGDRLLSDTRAAGVDVNSVARLNASTGTYTAVLSPEGELVVAVAAMELMDTLRPHQLRSARSWLPGAALVIVDGNLPPAVLEHVAREAGGAGVPLLLDPVSVPKARRARFLLRAGVPLHTVTPNRDELAALVEREVPDDDALVRAAHDLLALGLQRVWVRLGARGSLLCSLEGTHWVAAPAARVVDVTGAGDAAVAGYAYAWLHGHDEVAAVRFGHAAAALALETQQTVNPDLTPVALRARLEGAPS